MNTKHSSEKLKVIKSRIPNLEIKQNHKIRKKKNQTERRRLRDWETEKQNHKTLTSHHPRERLAVEIEDWETKTDRLRDWETERWRLWDWAWEIKEWDIEIEEWEIEIVDWEIEIKDGGKDSKKLRSREPKIGRFTVRKRRSISGIQRTGEDERKGDEQSKK